MKPTLPPEITDKLPSNVIHIIYSFVPRYEKDNVKSPSLERELRRIQTIELKGKNNMFMRDLDDFILR